MKKTLIGICLALIGTLGELAIYMTASGKMVSGWSTPPGRFMTTVISMGLKAPFVFSNIFLVLGLIILGIEYFKKEK